MNRLASAARLLMAAAFAAAGTFIAAALRLN